jgi:dipeptidyl aminopeptidase/acylaminoacyl peptidase
MMDENVHFSHTKKLVSELVEQNKPHQLQVYPMEKHGLRSPITNEHFETLMLYWLQTFL